ncbi:autoinducer binding domain-containing protein [Brevundimonas diminuta]|uniref:helix-turn-helix transcriptional regulator n=1 Tax=Brevundimonas diminuta TaxID=293 RepID=UPI0019B3DCE1|nr:LuxR family transcriptional regulator [Brevundimonas diminuta]MBD3818160.1 LuxR family transcriptional regulator [Brevundimonas diminuta]
MLFDPTLVQTFIDRARMLKTPEELRALMDEVTRALGFDYFALVHHVDLSRYTPTLGHMSKGQMVAVSTYPEAWIEAYIAMCIVANDPVLIASQQTTYSFGWDEIGDLIPITTEHRKIRELTIRGGIGAGLTVPANKPGEYNGSCNFAMRVGRELPPMANRHMAHCIGGAAFQAARMMVLNGQKEKMGFRDTPLPPRQAEIARLALGGRSNWVIGRMLGISPGTVKRHLEEARRHFDVSSREQVGLRAVLLGQFGVIDALR